MAFFVPMPDPHYPFAHRSEVIVSFFSTSDPASRPFAQPEELRMVLSEQEWHSRTLAIWKHFARYTWSSFQRIYLGLAICLSILGPLFINIGINRAFLGDLTPLSFDASTEEIVARVAIVRRAHLVNFIVVFSALALIWVPYVVWKAIGRKRLSALLDSFNKLDADKGNMQALVWTCSRTSTFQATGIITIHLPVALVSATQPTLFHPGAYLPSYMQGPPHGAPGAHVKTEQPAYTSMTQPAWAEHPTKEQKH